MHGVWIGVCVLVGILELECKYWYPGSVSAVWRKKTEWRLLDPCQVGKYPLPTRVFTTSR